MDKYEKRFFDRYNGKTIEDDLSFASEDFRKLARYLKLQLSNSARERGFSLAKFSAGHYDVSGFFEKDGKYAYFSYNVPRYEQTIDLKSRDYNSMMLYRTAESLNDYRGGSNHFIPLGDGFMDAIEFLLS